MGNNTQTTTQNQSSTYTADPRVQAAGAPLLSSVGSIANTAYNPGMNVNVAAMDPQQLAAIQGLGSLGSNNPAGAYITDAAKYAHLAADPNNVIGMTNAYYNPMSSQIMGQLTNVMGQEVAKLKGNEAATGAIGGSRSAVADSTLANQQSLAAGQIMSQLYNQAQQAALTTAGQQAGAAYSLGNLGQEALNTGLIGYNAALQGGNQLQGQQQNLYNAATQNAIQATLFPQQEAAAAANILAGIAPVYGGTTTGQSTTSQPVNMLGQIIGAGTTLAGLYKSDERTKENIEPIGKTFDNQHIYKFNYIGDPSPRIGLMAQEVEKKHPDAVSEINGTKAVDYNKATAKSAEIGSHEPLHRAIGGGTGIGNGVSGIAGFGGMHSGLEPYFAQSPQVQTPQMHYPTLNFGKPDNTAQTQADANAKGLMSLGQDLAKKDVIGDLRNWYNEQPTDTSASEPITAAPTLGGWQTSVQPSWGEYGVPNLEQYGAFGDQYAAKGGRIHRDDGGDVTADDLPEGLATRFIDRRLNKLIPPVGTPSPDVPTEATIASLSPSQPLPPDTTPSATNVTEKTASLAPPPDFVRTAAIASPAQAPAAIGHPGYRGLTQPQSVAQMGVDSLRNLGWSDSAIRGALANGNPESNFNPASRHWDQPNPVFAGTEAANAHGLFSFGGAEYNNYAQWLNKNGFKTEQWSDPVLQYRFMDWNLRTRYPQVFDAMQKGTPEEASQAFLKGYLKPRSDLESQRSEQLGKGVPSAEDLVKTAGQNAPSLSPQQAVGLIPERQGPSHLDRAFKAFGINLDQPQGFGGMLGRALGQEPTMDQQTSNRLVNMGLGMMAAGPSVGVKGLPGAAISALTAAGKGGQFALGQEQAERKQAIDLANAAMNQKLHEAQARHYDFEMKKPQEAFSDTVYDPTTGQMKFVKRYRQYNPQTNSFDWITAPSGSFDSGTADPNVVGPNSFDSILAARKAMADAQSKNVRGDAFMNTLPSTWKDLTQAALSGGLDVSRENDKNAPQNKIVRELALQADPDFNPNSFKYAEKWRDPNSTVGQARQAFPTAIDHMETALRNAKNIPDNKGWPTSKWSNKVSLWLSEHENEPWYTAQLANNELLADEVSKIAVASRSGSALADRDANKRMLDMANGRTAYLQVLQRFSELMASKGAAGMQGDWTKNMSRLSKAPDILTEEDKQRIANIKEQANAALEGKPITSTTTSGSTSQIPSAAVEALRKDPTLQKQFDAKYGTPEDPNPSAHLLGH